MFVEMSKIIQYTILFLVIPLYTAQGWLFESGSIVSQGLVLIWLLVDVYYTVVFISSREKTSISKPLLLFWAMIVLSWLLSPKEIHAYGWEIKTSGDLKNITIVLLSYFPFRYWLRYGYLRKKTLVLFLLFMTFASVMAFVTLIKKFDVEYSIINNTGYYFAMLVPLLGIMMNRKYTIAIFMVLLYFCIASAKRGAVFCIAIGIALFFYFSIISASKKHHYSTMVLAIVLFIIVGFFSYDIYMANDFLQYRMNKTLVENDTGGRDVIFSSLMNFYQDSNIINILFGHGLDKTVEVAGNFAHMDWLELLVDNGLLGAFLYLSLFYSMIKYYKKNRMIIGKDVAFIFTSTFSCWLLKSFVSMGYTHFFSFIFLAEYAYFENEVIRSKSKRSANYIKKL